MHTALPAAPDPDPFQADIQAHSLQIVLAAGIGLAACTAHFRRRLMIRRAFQCIVSKHRQADIDPSLCCCNRILQDP